MPSCKAHRQSAVTPLDLLTEIALEWRASVCSWLIRWIERLELSNRGKALRQASEQHCWETQGIIYQGWHVWLILQHTREVSPSPKNQIQALTQILREKGVKQGLIFGSRRRRRRRRQQLILNLFLRSIEIWVTAQSEAISILCGAPPHLPPPASASDLRFIMGPDGEVDICIVTPQRRVTPMQSISQSISPFTCLGAIIDKSSRDWKITWTSKKKLEKLEKNKGFG